MRRFTLRRANWHEAVAFIALHHRHHMPPAGWLWGIAADCRGVLVGIATIGRPVSRILAARGYVEVTRTCTTLWGVNRTLYEAIAAWANSARLPVCTYTQEGERGRSLSAAGWQPVAYRKSRPSDWRSPVRMRGRRVAVNRTRWEPAR